jgi:divalent metal cation (Fe/Co/Zn/Cd) transporter
MADAATSVLAIAALLAGKFWGASWLDPAMGLVGALLVALWARGLLRDTGRVLLDAEMDAPVVAEIREVVAQLPAGAVSPTCMSGGWAGPVRLHWPGQQAGSARRLRARPWRRARRVGAHHVEVNRLP